MEIQQGTRYHLNQHVAISIQIKEYQAQERDGVNVLQIILSRNALEKLRLESLFLEIFN